MSTPNPCFLAVELLVGSYSGKVYRIACPPLKKLGDEDFEARAVELADLTSRCDREGGLDTTVVLNVVESTIVPAYVDLAIEELLMRRARLGVLVQCGEETSHDRETTFPRALRENLAQMNHRGLVWHPVRACAVPAQPVLD